MNTNQQEQVDTEHEQVEEKEIKLLEIYKLHAQLANSVSTRRTTINRALFMLGVSTGGRISELLSLQIGTCTKTAPRSVTSSLRHTKCSRLNRKRHGS